jgi:hypothetical protein
MLIRKCSKSSIIFKIAGRKKPLTTEKQRLKSYKLIKPMYFLLFRGPRPAMVFDREEKLEIRSGNTIK